MWYYFFMTFLRKNKNRVPQSQTQEQTPIMIAATGNLATRAAMRGHEVSEEELTRALAELKISAGEAKLELKASAPPERLTIPGQESPISGDEKLFHMASWSERLIVEDDYVLNPWQYARPGQYQGPYDIPDDAPKGRRVTVMGHEDPSRPELTSGDMGLQRGGAGLLFMDDGQTMYKSYYGEQRGAQWSGIEHLPPDKAMALVDFVGAHVEAHRQNP